MKNVEENRRFIVFSLALFETLVPNLYLKPYVILGKSRILSVSDSSSKPETKMDNVEDDLSMQLGWNQLFQHFVSDLFSDGGEEKNAPVVTIDELQANGRGIGQTLTTLRNAIDFVRNKYAQNFTPFVSTLKKTQKYSELFLIFFYFQKFQEHNYQRQIIYQC